MIQVDRFYTDYVSIFVDFKNEKMLIEIMDCTDENNPKVLKRIEHEGGPAAAFNINFASKTINTNSKQEIKFSERLEANEEKFVRRWRK